MYTFLVVNIRCLCPSWLFLSENRETHAKTGLIEYTPHSLRHTAIELMKRHKFDYEIMQVYIGHKIPGVTAEYLTRLMELAGEELLKVEGVYKEILGIE